MSVRNRVDVTTLPRSAPRLAPMAQRNSSLESHGNRGYLLTVKTLSRCTLVLAVLTSPLSSPSSAAPALQPYFLVFNERADVLAEIRFLEGRGAVIRQCVPPRILV